MVGKVCLLQSVLSSLPLFYISFFNIPMAVVHTIKSIKGNFLWGWEKDGKKIAWIAWKKFCEPKEEGGLGIKDTRLFNDALLRKWIWHL